MPEFEPIRFAMAMLWERLRTLPEQRSSSLRPAHRGQWGYSTEAVVVTAALAALAIAVTAIIAFKVTQQANGITTR